MDAVLAMLRRYVAFPKEEAGWAVALWIAHTHVIDAFDFSPRLALLSAEMQSGKSRCMEVIKTMVRSPLYTANATLGALFRKIESEQVTILMDEVDTYLGRSVVKRENHEEIRGLLNAGFRNEEPPYFGCREKEPKWE